MDIFRYVPPEGEHRPLIGILTQPVPDEKRTPEFNYEEYILGINHAFVQMTGSQAVVIHYNSDSDEDNKRLNDVL